MTTPIPAIDMLRSRLLLAEGPAGDWSPIHLAPCDGRDFLALNIKTGRLRVCWRNNPSSRTDDIILSGSKSTRFNATHWTRIPAFPPA